MQSPTGYYGLAPLLCCSLLLLCPAAISQTDMRNGDPFNPNLTNVEIERGQRSAAPLQYVIVDLPDKKILHYYPELKGLVPAQSQQELAKLLEKVGTNENLLVNNIPSICAEEKVVQEHLDKHGWVVGLPAFTGQYNYLIRAHVTGEGIRFREGRSDENWRAVDPQVPSGYSLATHFALLPLHFHTFHQDAAHFRYLGRQTLDGREEYIIAFAQQPEKTELLGSVRINGTEITVAYQGIAWIDPDTSKSYACASTCSKQGPRRE